MRLPVRTGHQERTESARDLHERLYAAFLAGERIDVPVADGQPTAQAWQKLSGNLHRFWSERGFRLRGKSRGSIMQMWIEPTKGHV